MRALTVPVLLALAACAAGPGPAPASRADAATCVEAFRWYDLVDATMSTPRGLDGDMPIPPDLQMPVSRIRSLGCLTMSDDLAPMATASRPAVADGGALIPRTWVHAGVVTNMVDEAEAVAFFGAHGAPARGLGAAGLGRRIYVGPFATQGALDRAIDLAVAAGFAAPYTVGSF